MFGVRQAVSKSTGMTPYKIAFGKEPKLPFQLLNEQQLEVTVANTAVVDRLASFRRSIHDEAKKNIDVSQKKMKERHVLKKKQREKISVGDTVYKRNNRKLTRMQNKLRGRNWTGPFKVLSISPKGVAELKDFKGCKLRQKVSLSHLKLQRSRPVHLKVPSSTNLLQSSSTETLAVSKTSAQKSRKSDTPQKVKEMEKLKNQEKKMEPRSSSPLTKETLDHSVDLDKATLKVMEEELTHELLTAILKAL